MKCLHVFLIIFYCFLLPAKALAGNSEISERLVGRSNPNILSEDPIAEFGGFKSYARRYIACTGVGFYEFLLKHDGRRPVLNHQNVEDIIKPCFHYIDSLQHSIYEKNSDKDITMEDLNSLVEYFGTTNLRLGFFNKQVEEIYDDETFLSLPEHKRFELILEGIQRRIDYMKKNQEIYHMKDIDKEIEEDLLQELAEKKLKTNSK